MKNRPRKYRRNCKVTRFDDLAVSPIVHLYIQHFFGRVRSAGNRGPDFQVDHAYPDPLEAFQCLSIGSKPHGKEGVPFGNGTVYGKGTLETVDLFVFSIQFKFRHVI
ncbi:MAG: hypothetical protein IJS23_02660, partial [Clostridia bacterium]|nr:hypothetical protein [Clostridia bacterium]